MPAKRTRVLLVTYDLRSADEEHRSTVFDVLKSCQNWWHYIDSTWLVITTDDPNTLIDRLAPSLSNSERVLIMEVEPRYQGWLPEKAWKWMHKYLPSEG